jgi:hypothetical protein
VATPDSSRMVGNTVAGVRVGVEVEVLWRGAGGFASAERTQAGSFEVVQPVGRYFAAQLAVLSVVIGSDLVSLQRCVDGHARADDDSPIAA